MTASADTQSTLRPLGRRVPDFFIVGHPKSGTTALYGMLNRHPQIYMSARELWFFATAPHAPAPPRPPGAGRTPATLEEYLSLFDGATAKQLIGDYSTSYLVSHFAASRIAEMQPAARIIAILREPVSFLHSLHLQLLQNHVETEKDLRRAIGFEHDRREGRHLPRNAYWLEATQYSEHVRYVEQLRRYHALLGGEQILVLIYDDYRSDNEATLRRIQRFLGVDDTQPIEPRDANPTVRVRSQRLHELVHAAATGEGALPRAARSAVKALTPRQLSRESAVRIRNRILLANPRPPDESLTIELRQRFKPEVVALSEYLDRDLVTLWGYDSIE
jgi:hypothetical protein